MNKNILSIKNLTVFLGGELPVLQDFSLEISQNDIFFLLGPNGAGKTTLIKTILGLVEPSEGWVLVDNIEISFANRLSILRSIGVLIENASFYSHLTVEENARLFARYYNVPVSQVDFALHSTGLKDVKNKKGAHLSMGLKQRLGLALAIIHKPALVILDEPTSNLDPQAVVEFRLLIQRLNQELGVTFFITSHILSEVEKLATHVAVIREGQLLDARPMANITPQTLEQHYMNLMQV
jgi:lantibiotic transport system ATP-binding protein